MKYAEQMQIADNKKLSRPFFSLLRDDMNKFQTNEGI